MLKLTFLLIAIWIVSPIQAQQIIPFRLTESNNILIKTLVNDKDSLALMFQIAMEDAAISPERMRPVNHIQFNDEDVSVVNKIQVDKLSFSDFTFHNNELSGRDSDGKIGTKLFNGKVFKIDYDQSRFEIYEKLPNVDGYESIPIIKKDGVYFLSVTSTINSEELTHQFYLQSGYSGGLLYDNEFSDKNKLDSKLKVLKSTSLKNAAGKEVITKDAIIPFLKIGNLKLNNVSVGFFAGELKTQPLSIFGADLMKRFNWIFDVDRKIAYIQPSKYEHANSYHQHGN